MFAVKDKYPIQNKSSRRTKFCYPFMLDSGGEVRAAIVDVA